MVARMCFLGIETNKQNAVHRAEWTKIMNGDPVEINPSMGSGYKVDTRNRKNSVGIVMGNGRRVTHPFSNTPGDLRKHRWYT